MVQWKTLPSRQLLGNQLRHTVYSMISLGYIIIHYPNMDKLQYQLCAGPHTAKNHRSEVNLCRRRAGRGWTHTAAKCANYRGSHYTTFPICPVPKQVFVMAWLGRDKWREMWL